MEGNSKKCNLSKIKVMVIDEDIESLRQARSVLNTSNYQVTTCGNANCALAILQNHAKDFDFILLDVQMHAFSAFELLKIIKSKYGLLVILMVPIITREIITESTNYGASQVVKKPIDSKTVESFFQHVIIKRHHKIHHNIERFKELIDINNLSDQPSHVESVKNKFSKDKESNEEKIEEPHYKKQKLWSPALESKFLRAIDRLGGDGMPSIIVKLMNVEGLTRHQVASHLQKYRRRKEKQSNNSTNTLPSPSIDDVPVQSSTSFVVPATTLETGPSLGAPSSFKVDHTRSGDLQLVQQPNTALTPQPSQLQANTETGFISESATSTGGINLEQEMDKTSIPSAPTNPRGDSNRISLDNGEFIDLEENSFDQDVYLLHICQKILDEGLDIDF